MAWRAAVVLVVGLAAGFAASHVVMVHELAKQGAPPAEVRLVSWMAGLFAGSLAALLVGIAVLLKRAR